jgi:hypothetical protein
VKTSITNEPRKIWEEILVDVKRTNFLRGQAKGKQGSAKKLNSPAQIAFKINVLPKTIHTTMEVALYILSVNRNEKSMELV